MAAPTPETNKFTDSDMMGHAIRMIIPLKREFGVALDVPHFLHDFAYAKEMLDVALRSQDTRLRDNAAYLESKMFGPRNSSAKAKVSSPAPIPESNAAAAEEEKNIQLTEAEQRARMLSKYKTGLR